MENDPTISDQTLSSPATTAQLGAAVRARRRALGLTQQQLADLCSVGVVLVYEVEKGKSGVRLDKLLSILEGLGLQLTLGQGTPALTLDPKTANRTSD